MFKKAVFYSIFKYRSSDRILGLSMSIYCNHFDNVYTMRFECFESTVRVKMWL